MTVRDGDDPALPGADGRDDHLWDAARQKLQAGEPLTKAEANAYFAASLHNSTNQVYFRAGLIACREYMARFVEAESPTIAASIRANWWPQLGVDYGPPRLLKWDELAEGEPQLGNFRVKTENWTPTLEALPIAAQFLQAPIPGPTSEEAIKAEHTHGVAVNLTFTSGIADPLKPKNAGQRFTAYDTSYGTESRMQLPLGYEVVAEDVQPSTERGSWKCNACGFQGFWRGGPHCMSTGAAGVAATAKTADGGCNSTQGGNE